MLVEETQVAETQIGDDPEDLPLEDHASKNIENSETANGHVLRAVASPQQAMMALPPPPMSGASSSESLGLPPPPMAGSSYESLGSLASLCEATRGLMLQDLSETRSLNKLCTCESGLLKSQFPLILFREYAAQDDVEILDDDATPSPLDQEVKAARLRLQRLQHQASLMLRMSSKLASSELCNFFQS